MAAPAFRVVDSGSSGARLALVQYFDELASRFPEGFDTAAALSDAADAYAPPRGLFVIGGDPDDPDACGAVSFLDYKRAEIKRMWVSPVARGKGLATKLLVYLEDLSLQAGRTTIVLDTNRGCRLVRTARLPADRAIQRQPTRPPLVREDAGPGSRRIGSGSIRSDPLGRAVHWGRSPKVHLRA